MGRRIYERFGVLEDRRVKKRDMPPRDRDRTTMLLRNEIAHGGDILGDIKAIEYAQRRMFPNIDEYEEDFEGTYSIPFSEATAKISSFPRELIQTFDCLASVRELNHWQQPTAQPVRAAVEVRATRIISTALEADAGALQACFENGGELDQEFSQMEHLFVTGRHQM